MAGHGAPRTRSFAQKALHDAIFKAVEGDNREHAAFAQQRFGREQSRAQLTQFIVDMDPNRLKAARCGILLIVRTMAQSLAHHACQIAGGLQWARRDYRARNAA